MEHCAYDGEENVYGDVDWDNVDGDVDGDNGAGDNAGDGEDDDVSAQTSSFVQHNSQLLPHWEAAPGR